jgi:hypothetical protein
MASGRCVAEEEAAKMKKPRRREIMGEHETASIALQ